MRSSEYWQNEIVNIGGYAGSVERVWKSRVSIVVKWSGYDNNDNCWEPVTHLHFRNSSEQEKALII